MICDLLENDGGIRRVRWVYSARAVAAPMFAFVGLLALLSWIAYRAWPCPIWLLFALEPGVDWIAPRVLVIALLLLAALAENFWVPIERLPLRTRHPTLAECRPACRQRRRGCVDSRSPN